MTTRTLSARRLAAPIAALLLAAGAAAAQADRGAPKPQPPRAAPVPAQAVDIAPRQPTTAPVDLAPGQPAAAAPVAVVPRGAAPPRPAVAPGSPGVVYSVPKRLLRGTPRARRAAAARARARARTRTRRVLPALAPPVVAYAAGAPTATPASALCRPGTRTAVSKTPPSEDLKDTFDILRREPKDEDALPAAALAALKAQGLAPVDPQSARLLRADGAARAWVVPVPDAATPGPFLCAGAGKPAEGLAVVSVGGAPAGGGGTLHDLQRGIALADVNPCAGADRTMLGVSGIVPDDVEAVFVTAADGTATRADVHDNGYAFVLPRPRRPDARYLVWTGSDGKPHVQPLPSVPSFGRVACSRPKAPRITPGFPGVGCFPMVGPAFVAPVAVAPRPARRAKSRSKRASARARARRAPARPAPLPRRGRSKRPAMRLAPVEPFAGCVSRPRSLVVSIAPSTGRIRPAPAPKAAPRKPRRGP
jgi:hypothetical protein